MGSGLFEHHRGKEEAFGAYTRDLLGAYRRPEAVSSRAALADLEADLEPFGERLVRYVSDRAGVEPTERAVRRFLNAASRQKGLGLSSAIQTSWFAGARREVTITPRNLFKLCLALGLTIEEGEAFAYGCLYQGWLNCRRAEEAVYLFFVGAQDVFGDDAYAEAARFLKHRLPALEDAGGEPAEALDAAGYTRVLEQGAAQAALAGYGDRRQALSALEGYLSENAGLFSGVRRSASEVYLDYFERGGVGFDSLRELYRAKHALELPVHEYLDMAKAEEDVEALGIEANGRGEWYYLDAYGEVEVYDMRRKRLLWGSVGRRAFVERNGRDWDLLHESEVKVERHAVEAMVERGVPRGNIILVLFFCFALENEEDFASGERAGELFESFWRVANRTLVDQCGMLPLHPRKPFDRLVLTSLVEGATGAYRDPIEALNARLAAYYR